MAETKAITNGITKRCAERVKEARLLIASHVFGSQNVLCLGPGGGVRVEAMQLHPAGLMVLYGGKRRLIPMAHVEYVEIDADEQ